MKNMICCIAATVTLFLSTQTGFAQSITPADQKGIETCYSSFMTAFDKLDVSGLGAWLTENAEHIIPTGEIIRGRDNIVRSMAGYMEYLKTQPKPDRMDRKNVNMQSRYLAPGFIMSTYVAENTMTFGAKSVVDKTTTTVVFQKTGDKWLVELIALTPVVERPGSGK